MDWTIWTIWIVLIAIVAMIIRQEGINYKNDSRFDTHLEIIKALLSSFEITEEEGEDNE